MAGPRRGLGDVCIPVPCRYTVHAIDTVREAHSMSMLRGLTDDEVEWITANHATPGLDVVRAVGLLGVEVLASRKKLHAIGVQLKIWEADPDKNCYHDRVLRAILAGTP